MRVPRAGWRLWGSPVRFLRDALRARTLGANAGYDAAVDGLRENSVQSVGLASRCTVHCPRARTGFLLCAPACCSLGATPGVLENFLRPYGTD